MKNAMERVVLLIVALVAMNGCLGVEKMDADLNTSLQTMNSASTKEPAADFLEHTVRWRGETYIRISWWYTGSGTNWRSIADANPSISAKKIMIGDVLHIPARLVIRQEAMPEGYRVPQSAIEHRAVVVEEAAPDNDRREEPLELFGPVDTGQTTETAEKDDHLPLQKID